MIGAELKKTMPARVAAAGFIVFIIFGNLWLVLAVLGQKAPVWMGAGFAVGILLALGGGLGLAAVAVKRRLRPVADGEEGKGG